MGLVAELQPGDPREIGPYRTLGRLGSGGMGQVFLGMSAGGRPIVREHFMNRGSHFCPFCQRVRLAR